MPLFFNSGVSPNGDVTSFDNIGWAFLTIFQCITLEGWTDVMYDLRATLGNWVDLYFLMLILVGSFIVLNLIIAVIFTAFSVDDDGKEMTDAQRLEELEREAEVRDCVFACAITSRARQ